MSMFYYNVEEMGVKGEISYEWRENFSPEVQIFYCIEYLLGQRK